MSSRLALSALVTLGTMLALPASADAPLLRDANGAFVGFYTGILENQGLVAISATGYRYVVQRENGHVRGPIDSTNEEVYYEQTNCSPTPYVLHNAQFRGVVVPIRTNEGDLYAIYYVPQNAAVVYPSLKSKVTGGPGGYTCTPIPTTSGVSAMQALPNDPNTTGVPNADIPAPLSITRNEVFKDSYEAAMMGARGFEAFA